MLPFSFMNVTSAYVTDPKPSTKDAGSIYKQNT